MPKYVSIYHCVVCERQLSRIERLYNDGICPYCGYASKGTVADTLKTSVPYFSPLERLLRFLKKVFKRNAN